MSNEYFVQKERLLTPNEAMTTMKTVTTGNVTGLRAIVKANSKGEITWSHAWRLTINGKHLCIY